MENINITFSGNLFIENGERAYFHLLAPGGSDEIILISFMKAIVTWEDDDGPSIDRPGVYPTPDTITTVMRSDPILGDWNNQVSCSSLDEDLYLFMNIIHTPGMIAGNGLNLWEVERTSENENQRTDTFISVSCMVGEDNKITPLYDDPGEEISVNLYIEYTVVPKDVMEHWASQGFRKTSE